jgi:hypothetical protein
MATAQLRSLPEILPPVGETSRNASDQLKWRACNPQTPTYVAQATGRSSPVIHRFGAGRHVCCQGG